MNKKINFLNFFFESGKIAEDSKITETLADFFPAIVFLYDSETKRINYANKFFSEYFNLKSESLSYSDHVIENLVFADDAHTVNDIVESFNEESEKEVHQFTCRFKNDNGFRHFDVTIRCVEKGPEGKAVLLVIALDVHDRILKEKEAEVKKKLSEETEVLLQYGSWNLNVSTNEVAWTTGMYELLGYTKNQVSGRLSKDLYMSHVLPEYLEDLEHTISACIHNKQGFDKEYAIRTTSGEIKTVSTKANVILNDDGEVKGIYGITRDVTALRNSEREQERSLRELNRSNKELEEFAYVASHDLQEPLRKIAMFTERLSTKYRSALDKDGQLFMDRILVSADNMRVLIDNLLEFSRANRSSQAFAKISLGDVFSKVLSNLELKIEETKAKINFSTPLPTLEAVSSEMEQVFSNLISNALKFRQETQAPLVEVSSHKATLQEKEKHCLPKEDAYHVINIKDNGIGFEPEYAEKIFIIFQRLHGKAEYPGSGIGLAICKRIVDNHRGIIYASSLPGEGAMFTLILPEKQF